jgi:hypothetical protein
MTTQVVILRFGGEFCFTLREVETCHDGILQQAVRPPGFGGDAASAAVLAMPWMLPVRTASLA